MASLSARRPVHNSVVTKTTSTFIIGGMTCVGCVARVKRSIEAVEGVSQAIVDLDTETAEVIVLADGDRGGDGDGDASVDRDIVDAVEGTGKTATLLSKA